MDSQLGAADRHQHVALLIVSALGLYRQWLWTALQLDRQLRCTTNLVQTLPILLHRRIIREPVSHLALNVKDVEASLEFYRKLVDIEPSKVRTGYAKFDVQNPPLNLTLNQHVFNEPGALSHLGIQVAATDDVLAIREQWISAGLLTRDEMQTSCCYALQDKTWVVLDNLAETAPCECGTRLAVKEAGCC